MRLRVLVRCCVGAPGQPESGLSLPEMTRAAGIPFVFAGNDPGSILELFSFEILFLSQSCPKTGNRAFLNRKKKRF